MLPIPGKSALIHTRQKGFTLIELLVVVVVMLVLMGMVAPAFIGMKGAGDVTKAVYDVSGVLQTARSYALANNTYVWVGFYEESVTNPSTPSTPWGATPGTGRVVMSIVASSNGTPIYNTPLTSSTNITTGLTQVAKLVKIDNMHLLAFSGNLIGTGTGNGFTSRPAVSGTAVQIGSMLYAGGSQAPFQYPLGNPAPTPAQYTFTTAIQFSPRGEARLDDSSHPLQPLLEIGIEPTQGAMVPANNLNVAAVQITGIAGNVQIYRQ